MESTIAQIANRIRDSFNILLQKMLLCKFERQQNSETMGMGRPREDYGYDYGYSTPPRPYPRIPPPSPVSIMGMGSPREDYGYDYGYSTRSYPHIPPPSPVSVHSIEENMPLVEEIGEVVLSEAHVEWKVPNFFSLLYKKVDSPFFSFAGEKWYLRLYPKGEFGLLEDMALNLQRMDLGGSLKTVFFTFGIKGLDGVEEMEEIEYNFEGEKNGYGFTKFMSRFAVWARKTSLMPSSDLTITCDLRSNPHPNVVTGEENLGKSLLSMFEDGEDTDVVIKVQGKEFPAHRNILRARSPVFKSMFAHDMVEKQSGVMTIEDCDADAFKDFLVYIYSGSSESITTRNVSSLYMAADKYDIYGLKEECVKFMIKNLSITFLCDVIELAVKYDEKKLIERATNFFCDNSLKIVNTAKWEDFLKKYAILGNELLSVKPVNDLLL